MEGYLVLDWPPGTASDQAREMRRDLLGQGWRVAYEEFCILVLVRGERTPPVHVLPGRGGVVLGDVFDTEATAAGEAKAFDLGLLAGLEARDAATVLTRCAWGRYIAVFTKLDAAPSVLRDPLGGIDGVAWRSGPLTLVSDAPPLTGPAAPSGLGIDWARVGDLLADIALVSGPPCLAGVVGIGPGELWDASEDQWIPVWTPARQARIIPPMRRPP